jgi:integrase
MNAFLRLVSVKIDSYVQLRRSLGSAFESQASTLWAFQRFIERDTHAGPLTQKLVLAFVLSCDVTPNVRARRYGVLKNFADYFSVFDPRTETLDPHALPRSRAVPPVRFLDCGELGRLLKAARECSRIHPIRGYTLYTLIGLLASTGLRSGEALRLDRSDVELDRGVLLIRKTKFRKDRIVPVHPTTRAVLADYATTRAAAYPGSKSPAFFMSLRGGRLSKAALNEGFRQASVRAGLSEGSPRGVRPHDLRHRFAVTRLVAWHKDGLDVQARLPILATYLGHVRYSDTAYYVTGTPELLTLAADRAFARKGGES